MSTLPTGVWGRDPIWPLDSKETGPIISAGGGDALRPGRESSSWLGPQTLLLFKSGGLGVLLERKQSSMSKLGPFSDDFFSPLSKPLGFCYVLFTHRDDLTTCCFCDGHSAFLCAQSAASTSSQWWDDSVHSESCWCACAFEWDPLHQRWAWVNLLTHCCHLSLWNPDSSSNAWKEGCGNQEKNAWYSVDDASYEWIAAAPVQRAVRLHRRRLTEGTDPTQHILLSVGTEEIRAHSLVHHLVLQRLLTMLNS